jgi:hypothetical protein
MAGLVPAIRVFFPVEGQTWMPAASAGMTGLDGFLCLQQTPLIPAQAGIQKPHGTQQSPMLHPAFAGTRG